ATFFLGDNIYPLGMPDIGHAERKEAEQILIDQIDLVKNFNTPIIFIPGNHDWKKGKQAGKQQLHNQQAFLDSLNNPQLKLLPRDACPGPEIITISNKVIVFIIDSQWFLHPWDKPIGDDSPCSCKKPIDVMLALKELFVLHANKQKILLAHHPVLSYSEHGGVFPISAHLFPLRSLHKNMYLPLPGIGSVYPAYRKYFGNIQDLAHPLAKQYQESVHELLKNFPGSVYINGHEHALQHAIKDNVHYITSGSGVKATYVRKKKEAVFASSQHGFITLDFLNDKSVIQFWQVDKSDAVHRIEISLHTESIEASKVIPVDYQQEIVVSASNRYGKKNKFWLGRNYRDVWLKPVSVKQIDVRTKEGGLKILQKGGGMQTLSLRLEDKKGNEYTLRSVEKYPEKAVPDILKKTFAQDLVQDQISASHPYAALTIPALAKAAGVYYTKPELVFIPNDTLFGIYQQDFANTLAIYEERPAGDGTEKENFGNTKKIISTEKVLTALQQENDVAIDQPFVARNRLFDLLIGDWDRHDDQWRWASFKTKDKTIYRPIPRDRDQAFFVSDGMLAKVWSRRWALPKFEGFNETVRWTPGFMFNARYFDRSFLNELSLQEWLVQAQYIQAHVTDAAIDSAMLLFPKEVYALHAKEIKYKIIARRNKLHQYAKEHYRYLAREIDIPATDKRELFKIDVSENGNANVQVYKVSKKGKVSDLLYSRNILASETKEVRLYGRAGDDVFKFSGDKSKIKFRVIGGEGNDTLQNTSHEKVFLYDVKNGIFKNRNNKFINRISNDPSVNEYNRRSFQYPRLAPLVYGNFNFDDGLFIGGGFLTTTHGFRKTPYKSQHLFLASHALLTESYNFKYDGRFTDVIGKFSLYVDADLKAPNFINNFFGWGNETKFDNEIDEQPDLDLDRPIDYYRIRTEELLTQLKLQHRAGNFGFWQIGLMYQRAETDKPISNNRFIAEFGTSQPEGFFENVKNFGGPLVAIGVEQVDNKINPSRGIRALVQNRFMIGFDKDAANFTATDFSVSFYQSFRKNSRT
ncbi:MAG: metallophosphoesterase, partial [Cyclobacteriaceae bacterium]|nr:metallophosphoesterase [Cyclobacteriaceae bacterium]